MKKIILFCAAIVAAMSSNAQKVMTADEAYNAAIALTAGDTLTNDNGVVEIVEVTAYVTDGLNGTIDANGQQTFWVGATKDETTKTLQVYKCDMPKDAAAVSKGDKVKITGKLMHFRNASGSTDCAELVKAAAEILEQVKVKSDTLSDLSICELIEEGESLNAGEYSTDFFELTAVIDSLSYTNAAKKQQTFFFYCEDNNKTLQAYNAEIQGDEMFAVGDEVKVLGKITNYQKKQIEFETPKAWLVKKAEQPAAQKVTIAEAVKIGMELAQGSIDQKNTYIVEGYIAEIATAYNTQYNNISFYMTDAENGEERNFEVYRGSYPTDELKEGDKVFVQGQLQHYYKAGSEDGTTAETDVVELINGTITLTDPTTAVETLRGDAVRAQKIVDNGVIYIINNGVRYNVLGAQVK